MTLSSRFHAVMPSLANSGSLAHRYTLLVILLLGLGLRLYAWYVGQAFLYYAVNDELSAWHMAMRLLNGESVAWYLGQPNFSNGQVPGPLWSLFWAGIYILGGHSVHGASLIVGLLNTLVIYLVYRLARQLLTPTLALLTAFFYATSPWTIYYSVGLWNPLVLAILGSVLFLCLWRTTTTDNSAMIFWVCVLCAAIPQFHMIGLFYIPAVLLVLWLAPTRWHRGWLVVGILAGIALYLPYLWFDWQHHWQNTHAMLISDERRSLSSLKIVSVSITMLSFYPSSWIGYEFNEFLEFADHYFLSHYVFLGLCLLSVVFAVLMLGSFLRRVASVWRGCHWQLRPAYRQQPVIFFVFLLLVLPLLLFMLTWHNYNSRYLIIALPLLLFVPVFYYQASSKAAIQQWVVRMFIFSTLINLYLVGVYYADIQRRINTAPLLLPSFHQLETIATALHQHAGANVNIEVDSNDFRQQNTDSYSYIIANAIRDYMIVAETYTHQHATSTRTVTYKLIRDENLPDTNSAVGYRGHGIELIALPPERGQGKN